MAQHKNTRKDYTSWVKTLPSIKVKHQKCHQLKEDTIPLTNRKVMFLVLPSCFLSMEFSKGFAVEVFKCVFLRKEYFIVFGSPAIQNFVNCQ